MALEMERTLKPEILAVRLIPNVHPDMAKALELLPGEKSLALFTCNIDDPLYIGGDEATKKAEVRVAYCRSHFAGGAYPSGPLSGECMLLLAAPNPAEATAGINAVLEFVDSLRYSTVTLPGVELAPTLVWLAYTISRSGTYLSKEAGVEVGTPIAYITAPPLEGHYAMERALKAADVKVGAFTRLSETNYHGAYLYGTQSACRAACRAFDEAVLSVANDPLAFQ
ncbi:MAG TPA: ethanolamine utilization microcompartment protein EutL [Candidatus Cryosericum sp.]|nr:ethanolamine utilization microcompartment protein EutL [Candidatus Cryosericum sp.]HPS69195.1 ethanolamine utilization microcompartment protein EutL [Candidatus Cryosericum sp.]